MKGYFITGTGTGVGKTFVTCALARRAREHGHEVFAFKPIETGCEGLGSDQTALVEAAGGWQTGELRGVYQFPLPAAPLVAGVVDLDRVLAVARAGGTRLVLVEGAGGWRVPITATADMSTLARALGVPVVIVGLATLGTINHTLLTIEAVERDGCAIGAVVLSLRPEDDVAFAQSNRDEIARRWPGRVLILGTDRTILDAIL